MLHALNKMVSSPFQHHQRKESCTLRADSTLLAASYLTINHVILQSL